MSDFSRKWDWKMLVAAGAVAAGALLMAGAFLFSRETKVKPAAAKKEKTSRKKIAASKAKAEGSVSSTPVKASSSGARSPAHDNDTYAGSVVPAASGAGIPPGAPAGFGAGLSGLSGNQHDDEEAMANMLGFGGRLPLTRENALRAKVGVIGMLESGGIAHFTSLGLDPTQAFMMFMLAPALEAFGFESLQQLDDGATSAGFANDADWRAVSDRLLQRIEAAGIVLPKKKDITKERAIEILTEMAKFARQSAGADGADANPLEATLRRIEEQSGGPLTVEDMEQARQEVLVSVAQTLQRFEPLLRRHGFSSFMEFSISVAEYDKDPTVKELLKQITPGAPEGEEEMEAYDESMLQGEM